MNINRNNTGNIRKNPAFKWQGELDGTPAGEFVSFDTLVNGYRAQIKLLNNYIKAGHNTIEKIITRWSPVSDGNANNANYIKYLSDKLGIFPETVIAKNDFETLKRFAYWQSFFEHGIHSDNGTFASAATKAKNLLTGVVDLVVSKSKANPIKTILLIAAAIYLLSKIK